MDSLEVSVVKPRNKKPKSKNSYLHLPTCQGESKRERIKRHLDSGERAAIKKKVGVSISLLDLKGEDFSESDYAWLLNVLKSSNRRIHFLVEIEFGNSQLVSFSSYGFKRFGAYTEPSWIAGPLKGN